VSDFVTNIDDYRQHLVIQGDNIHVIPMKMFLRIAKRELKSKDIEDLDDILPVIINEWLERFD
jgi:hypothetical protein